MKMLQKICTVLSLRKFVLSDVYYIISIRYNFEQATISAKVENVSAISGRQMISSRNFSFFFLTYNLFFRSEF